MSDDLLFLTEIADGVDPLDVQRQLDSVFNGLVNLAGPNLVVTPRSA